MRRLIEKPLAVFSAGFSLIEIMVVMLFIGIMFSIATVSISADNANRQLRDVVENFLTHAGHFQEVAIASGVPVGVYLEPPQWQEDTVEPTWQIRWYKLEPVIVEPTQEELEQRAALAGTDSLVEVPPKLVDTWVEVQDIRAAGLSEDILLELKIQDVLVEFGREPPEVILPQIVFNPTGEMTHFELVLTHDEDTDLLETIVVDEWGDIVWKEEAEALEALAER